MKIIILGAGQVGGTLAENLANEKIDITVIDNDLSRLRELQDRLDIATTPGHGSHPAVLRKAGIEDADMLVAVTGIDEINMIACQIAHSLFRTPSKICRIRDHGYVSYPDLFSNDSIPVDVIISPEQLVTQHIIGLLALPGALQVLDFANGRAQLIGIKSNAGDKFIGVSLEEIGRSTPKHEARVAAIYRGDRSIKPQRETQVEPLDEVFFIAAKENIRPVMKNLGQLSRPYKRIMIAGGGNIGLRLATAIEDKYDVKLIEYNSERARYLSATLNRVMVLKGSASDSDLLHSESIESVDVFIALTNDDEANIMSSLLAKKMGARKVITLITNPAYVDLVQGGGIDIAFSPQIITMSGLLTHVRRGDMANVHSLRRGAAEALEIIAHGDSRSSKVVGRTVEQLDLPDGVRIGAIVRGDDVIIPHKDFIIESDDHVVVFLVDKTQIAAVERLFQVGFGFF